MWLNVPSLFSQAFGLCQRFGGLMKGNLTVKAIVPLFVFLNKKAVAEKLISYCLPEIFTHTQVDVYNKCCIPIYVYLIAIKCEAQKADLTSSKTFFSSITNSSQFFFLSVSIPTLSKIFREKSFVETATAPWQPHFFATC